MEEDTDDEGHEEEEDEYVAMCLFGSLGYLYGIHIFTIFLIMPYVQIYFAGRVQMNIQMMKMPAGKFAEQQLNA